MLTEKEIRDQISKCEDKIDKYESTIKTMENQVALLEALNCKYTAYQSDFETCQSTRNTINEEVSSIPNSSNITEHLYEGLYGFLNGEDYQNAYNELSSAKEDISNRIENIVEDISKYNGYISTQEIKIDNLKQQLKNPMW